MKISNIICQATSNLSVSIPDSDKMVVLYFYPKDATPGCTLEGQDFRDNYDEFVANNAIVYGVSRDSISSHEKFKAKQKFPFELIADTDNKLASTLGVIGTKKMYGKEYVGIIRSTFIIAPSGEVVKEWRNVKVKGHVAEVLIALQQLP